MPELPEVETIRRGLSKLLPGKRIAVVRHDWPKSFPNSEKDVEQFVIGCRITAINRRAKVLMIELDSNYTLVCHLKMTGQMVYVGSTKGERFGAGHPSAGLINELPDKSTRVTLDFDDGSQLFFNDQRKFGWMRLLPTAEVPNIDFFKKVGPEPLAADFTAGQFRDRLIRRPNSSVKAALLDQTVIAGIGNIYADESLWAAGIHPQTRVRDISKNKMNNLFKELQAVLRLSIKKGGSSDRNYVDASGKKGSYLNFAKVFRKQGQPCPRHPDILIQKIRVAGRGTHICAKCQGATDE